MGANDKELKITISAAADASVAAVEQRLLKGYRDVKNQLQPIPLQLTAAFRQEAVLQAAESLRSQMQRVADRQAIRFVAEIDSRQARHIALGLGSGGAQNFGGPRPFGEQLQGSQESFREFERNARTQLLGAFRQNLPGGSGQFALLEQERVKLLDQQNKVEAQTLEAIRSGAATADSIAEVRTEHARQLKLLDNAIIVATQQQAQAARNSAIQAARAVDYRATEQQRIRYGQIGYQSGLGQAELRGNIEEAAAAERTQARRREIDAGGTRFRGFVTAGPVGGEGEQKPEGGGYGGLNEAFGGVRALFGRYSPVAQAIQFVRGAGPLLAFGLAAHESEQIATAWEKASTEIRSGAKSTGEATDELVRSIPLVGQFYSAWESIREITTGEKAEIKRINDLLDYQTESRKHQAAQSFDALHQIQAIRQETEKIGLAGPKLGLEDIRQEQQGRIQSATEQAQSERTKTEDPNDPRTKSRLDAIRAARQHALELSEKEFDLVFDRLSQKYGSGLVRAAAEHERKGEALSPLGQQIIADARRFRLELRTDEIDKANREVLALEKDAADERLRIEDFKQGKISAATESGEKKRLELLRQYHQQILAEERESADKILKIQAELVQQQIRIQAQAAVNANRAQQDKAKYEGRGLDVIGLEAKGQREAIESARQEQSAKTREDIRARASSLGQDIGKSLPELIRGFDLGGTTNKIDLKQIFTGLLPFPELKQEFRKPDLGYDAEHLRNVANRVKTWWQELLGINVKGQLDQKANDDKAKADADHVRDEELRRIRDDAREVRDEKFRHDQDMNRLNAETTSNRLRLMGLDYQAEAVQRRAALVDRINELRHAAQLEIEQHKERQPEIEKRLGESERGEVEKFKSERSLDILGEIQRMRQSASLPQTTEARFLTQVPGFAHAKLEADLIVDAQHRMQDVLHQDLVEISAKIGGEAAKEAQIAPTSVSVPAQLTTARTTHAEYTDARHAVYQQRNREINAGTHLASATDRQIHRDADIGVRLAMSTARPEGVAHHAAPDKFSTAIEAQNKLLMQILAAIPNLTVPARAYPEGTR